MTVDATFPDPPPVGQLRKIGIRSNELRITDPGELWWRAHRTQSRHPLAWNEFRTYGPLLRFDHHPVPLGEYPGHGVWYGAGTPDAALAEAFQGGRTIDRVRENPYLTGLRFTRSLRLLDLAADSEGAWATRAGGTFAISTAPHAVTQRWARSITEGFPDLDGIRYNSRFAGHPYIALFSPAAGAMPARPEMSLPLSHPGIALRVAGAARRLGYSVI